RTRAEISNRLRQADGFTGKRRKEDGILTACILQDYRTDRCVNCTHLCPHRIAFHGLNDNGGRTADVKTPKDYRHVTLSTSPCRKAQSDIYRKLDVYASTFKRHLTGGERAKSLYL